MYSQIDFPSLARSRDVEKIRNSAPVLQMTSAVFIRDKKQLMSRVDIICGGRKKKRLVKRYNFARRFNHVCIRSAVVIGIRDPRNWSRQRL